MHINDNPDVLELIRELDIDIHHVPAKFGAALHAVVMMACASWHTGVNVWLEHGANPSLMSECYAPRFI